MKRFPMAIILTIVLLAMCAALFACNDDKTPTYSVIYDGAELYEASSTCSYEGVKEIELNWLNGLIMVEVDEDDAPPSNAVRVNEAVSDGVGEELRLHHRLDEDGVLHLKFASSGTHKIENGFQKNLTIALPNDLCLAKLRLVTVNAAVKVYGAMSRDTEIVTVGGDVQMYTGGKNYDSSPRRLSVETVTGGVGLNILNGFIDEGDFGGDVIVKNGSGSTAINVNAYVPRLSVSSTSGRIDTDVNTGVDSYKLETMSGFVKADLNAMIARFEISSLSSYIELNAYVAPKATAIASTSSTISFRLNTEGEYKITTNSRIEISFIDLSNRTPAPVGYTYIYPSDGSAENYSEVSIIGSGITLRLEELEKPQ